MIDSGRTNDFVSLLFSPSFLNFRSVPLSSSVLPPVSFRPLPPLLILLFLSLLPPLGRFPFFFFLVCFFVCFWFLVHHTERRCRNWPATRWPIWQRWASADSLAAAAAAASTLPVCK